MSEIPTISVTKDEGEFDDNCDNDYEGNSIAGAHTDIEDMESNDEGELLCDSNNIHQQRSPFTTDIEDYNDSCSDDETSDKYPVLKVSLQEFLNHGIIEERTYSNELDGAHEIKADNFLSLKKPKRIDDCPTDYENYSISSDDENFEKKSICLDLSLIHLENDNIESHVEKVKDSDDELSKSECIDYLAEGAGCISEDELIELSENEVEMQISCSTSEEDSTEERYPVLGFTFASDKKSRKVKSKSKISVYLEVSANCEESLTDIEKIDLSAAEDSGDENVIPIAVMLDSTENSNTDVEDMHLSECTKMSDDIETINSQLLPLPHREMVLIREDKNGDPITNVVAMENDFLFGLANSSHDDTLTDVEDMSSAIDDNSDVSCKDIAVLVTLENEEVLLSENVKSCLMKRNDYLENLTDTEEIFEFGLVRRKKCKSKTLNKSKSKHSGQLVVKHDGHTKLESDEPTTNIASAFFENAQCGPLASANEILNESFTVVHDKCINMFNVEKEKQFIKGLQECVETHTDVEYVEEELVKED